MKAIGKYIAIKPCKIKPKKTSGGLILSENEREDIRYVEAEVLVVGGAVSGLKTKDKIYYDKAAGFDIEIAEKTYKVIQEKDVVIVL